MSIEDLGRNFEKIMKRYGVGATPDAFVSVLCPLLLPIRSIDKTVRKEVAHTHWHASFEITITPENEEVLVVGRTGKFVPSQYEGSASWKEISKGRIISVADGVAYGEIYTGAKKSDLEFALTQMTGSEFLEIDQFGAAAKVLSGLAEYELSKNARQKDYSVRRMPEDMAKHLGNYKNYDFEFSKNGKTQKVEVKSLWGTDTRYARLIHSTTTKPKGAEAGWTENEKKNYYPTSSCKFATQDIFAVSLFLRTGNIADFAFAKSRPGPILKPCAGYSEHVNQNPLCEIDNITWFDDIDRVWT